jgi:hypothetical protein
MLPDQPGHQPAQEPRNRLWAGRNDHLELPHPDRVPAEPPGYRRASLKAYRADHDHQRAGYPVRPRVGEPGFDDDARSAATAPDAGRMSPDAGTAKERARPYHGCGRHGGVLCRFPGHLRTPTAVFSGSHICGARRNSSTVAYRLAKGCPRSTYRNSVNPLITDGVATRTRISF